MPSTLAPSTCVMTSPSFTPAWSAGPPFTTELTTSFPFARPNAALDPLRALFAGWKAPGQVVLSGAAFLRGFADRAPDRFDVAVPRSKSI